jgi:serine protease AprX
VLPVLLSALLRLLSKTQVDDTRSVLVVLREQADLSGASEIGDRLERRQFVYEALREQAERSQEPLRRRLSEAGVRFRSHWLLDMLEVEADAPLIDELVSRDDVALVAANRPARLARPVSFRDAESAAPKLAEGIEPNVAKIRAPELWSRGFTGQGIVIGMADTGFQWDHPTLKPHYRGWNGEVAVHDYNWHDAVHDAAPGNPCGSDAPAPCDDQSHGTGTAGVAVGDDGLGNRIGVAPGASLIGCRNMDQGSGTPARYTECFEWLFAPTDSHGENPRPDLGADVINNSWSCPAVEGCTNPEILRGVVENLRAAGIAVVVAAGNGGNRCFQISEAPSIYDASITVGATDLQDAIASFSSFGPVSVDGSGRIKPDLCAPGVRVRTAGPGGTYTIAFSGTSASAPHVTGAFALLWCAEPALRGNVFATERLLELSAIRGSVAADCGGDSGSAVPNPAFGWGRIDVEAADETANDRPVPALPVPRPAPRFVPPRG